jgi:tyrosyl-tRNA synthetase
MGKTAAGAVWLAADRTSPFDFYQYFVNVDDRDVGRFLKLLTFLPLAEIDQLAALQGAELRTAKQALAFAVTEIVHGREAAEAAQKAAQAAFGGGGAEELVPTVQVDFGFGGQVKIVDLLVSAGLAPSKSAARRLIEQGGVRVGDRKISSIDDTLASDDTGKLLHAGKKHVRRIKS